MTPLKVCCNVWQEFLFSLCPLSMPFATFILKSSIKYVIIAISFSTFLYFFFCIKIMIIASVRLVAHIFFYGQKARNRCSQGQWEKPLVATHGSICMSLMQAHLHDNITIKVNMHVCVVYMWSGEWCRRSPAHLPVNQGGAMWTHTTMYSYIWIFKHRVSLKDTTCLMFFYFVYFVFCILALSMWQYVCM